MMCIIYESYGIGCADIVCIICTYILCYGGRDPYCTGGGRRRCYINISGGRDRYGTGGGEDGVYIIYREEGTRITWMECEDGATVYIYLQLYK